MIILLIVKILKLSWFDEGPEHTNFRTIIPEIQKILSSENEAHRLIGLKATD